MSKNLLIVESPAKAKTINKYLGSDFKVLASYGHVRDLVPKEGAVDPADDFAMKYDLIDKNRKHVDAIVKAAKKAEAIYLATDLDREGEAISWHISEILKQKGIDDDKPIYRAVFGEITKKAVSAAVDNPRELSHDLVDAQQARRALDYLVGFNLSPLLWKKVRTGLSAGRVQSPALRLIVEREDEIEAFEPQEFWTIDAQLEKSGQGFTAGLWTLDGERVEKFDINNDKQASELREKLLAAAKGSLTVSDIERKQRKRRPAPPFITSTLQQDASRKLGFSTSRTMRAAQQLYEGVQIEGGNQGLITYMRTDSVSLSGDALSDMRGVIGREFGEEMVPEKPNFYKSKSKNAQEAHEAIRPVSAALTPKRVKQFLKDDQYRLYSLIWKRALASQMKPAEYDTVAATLPCGHATFRATGSVITFPGFLSVYEVSRSSTDKGDDDRQLPDIKEGDSVKLLDIDADQHFTQPPPRYSEASLVKALEELGIGRPSTYASIISTLQNREYVEMDGRRFIATDTGRVIARFLSNHFDRYVDYDFTARLEDELDAISRGEQDWVPLLEEFWQPFIDRVKEKEESVSRDEARQTRQLGTDPDSGKPVLVRLGRYGPYAQIGEAEDDDKPRFAGLLPDQRLDTITLEQALKLFDLPRDLGETPEGEEVQANIGRYGPYVRYGSKFVSLKDGDDPYTVTLSRALELIAEKKQADANRIIQEWKDEGIQVLRGRYGPYITDGNKNARMPKDKEPEELTLEECQKLIAEAPERRRGRRKKKKTKKKAGKKKAAGRKKTGKKKTRKKTSKKATKKTGS